MAAGTFDIVVEQGATFTRTINIKDSLNAPINLTSVTSVRGQIRPSFTSSVFYAFDLAVTNAALGVISWGMSASATGAIGIGKCQDFVYDVELVRGADVERLLMGSVTISQEVTR